MNDFFRPEIEITLHSGRLVLDDRPMEKRVGLVILATDHTTEPDFQRMVASDRIGVYVARLPYTNPTTPDNLRRMQPALTTAASLILPDEPLDVLCYSCTSASVVIGDAAIKKALQEAKPGVEVVTPTLAASVGLRSLGASRISLLTPYTIETSRPMAHYFAGQGFQIDRFTCMGLDDDREMARMSRASLADLAAAALAPESEALFISCTALRSAPMVAELEAALSRPVITSNLATAWMCLRTCGDHAARPELGQLMTVDPLS